MSNTPASLSLWTASKIFMGLSAVCGLWWYGTSYDPETPNQYLDPNRNYATLPFDMLDAQNICQVKTEARYGDTLLRTQVDSHSTRYEENSGQYKVFMSAHLGNNQIYDEAMVYCFVDADEYVIDHYRVVQSDQKSLMARAKSFFSL